MTAPTISGNVITFYRDPLLQLAGGTAAPEATFIIQRTSNGGSAASVDFKSNGANDVNKLNVSITLA